MVDDRVRKDAPRAGRRPPLAVVRPAMRARVTRIEVIAPAARCSDGRETCGAACRPRTVRSRRRSPADARASAAALFTVIAPTPPCRTTTGSRRCRCTPRPARSAPGAVAALAAQLARRLDQQEHAAHARMIARPAPRHRCWSAARRPAPSAPLSTNGPLSPRSQKPSASRRQQHHDRERVIESAARRRPSRAMPACSKARRAESSRHQVGHVGPLRQVQVRHRLARAEDVDRRAGASRGRAPRW